MPADALMALAQFAGQTVATAAITDAWESARQKIARLIGRGDARRTETADSWLAQTHKQLAALPPGELKPVQARQAERWTNRFADLLDEDPATAAELRALAEELATRLPVSTASATDHSLAAGRDMNITASGGSVAAGVMHGDIAPPGPTQPGPAQA